MEKHYSIGVDLGGTNLRAALVTPEGEVVKSVKYPSAEDTMATLKKAVQRLMQEGVKGVGIGVAGLLDASGLVVAKSPHLPEIEGRSFEELGLDVPICVQNDASAAALGEARYGAGKGLESFVLMTLGTGIGGGIFYNGRLLDVAAEIGHMCVEARGKICACGNHGCLELYASASALQGAATEALEAGAESTLRECCRGNIYRITPEDIYAAARDGDALSRELLKSAGRYLGVGIANMVNILSPRAVILTGGLTGTWDILVAVAEKEVERRAFGSLLKDFRILPSALGPDEAGVLGAAALVFHEQENS